MEFNSYIELDVHKETIAVAIRTLAETAKSNSMVRSPTHPTPSPIY